MYPPGEDTEDLPSHLTSDMVTLTHSSIESAIIATTYWGDDGTLASLTPSIMLYPSYHWGMKLYPSIVATIRE